MAHFSENAQPLILNELIIKTKEDLFKATSGFNDVCVIRLPASKDSKVDQQPIEDIGSLIKNVAEGLGQNATLVVLGETVDLVQVQASMPTNIRYQLWIAVKRTSQKI